MLLVGLVLLPFFLGEVIAGDRNEREGFVLFCPCMGRFGNQVETFLGTFQFAKQLNRTLVLPPFLEFPYGQREATVVPFDRIFQVEPLKEFHRVITMEEFMSTLAANVWPKEERKVFCWTPRESAYGKKEDVSCQAKEGNPFGPFWDHYEVDFADDVYFGDLGYEVAEPKVAAKWLRSYPISEFPVLAFSSAPAAFPIEPENRFIQQFFRWSEQVQREAEEFVNVHLKRPFVGIHLRNGADWTRACEHVDPEYHFFASAQCTGDFFEFGPPTKELCLPSHSTIIKDLKAEVERLEAKSVFVSSDHDFMLSELNAAFNKSIGIRKMPTDNPYVSLAVLDLADHLIANCMSTFSGLAVRNRRFSPTAEFKSHSFFGMPKQPVHKAREIVEKIAEREEKAAKAGGQQPPLDIQFGFRDEL
ncbi:GDP-fucose protein O-fucosyltransferase 1 [Aphelenchoides fujianensis]|nr:GDP-fucose protein O-fucosyltransferase 1 [Aphelenchoides fujianensis]